jgi:FkbM family methyltransferase
LRGGVRVEFDLRDRIQGMAFLTRDYEPALVRFVASKLTDGGVFVDVGAHVGLVSLSAASRCRSAGVQVHAFEPEPANAAQFESNVSLNPDLDVVVNKLAVGADSGTVVLRRGTEDERAWGAIVEEEGDREVGAGDLEVECTSLSSYVEERGIARITLLKVDVEGYEPKVLEGAESLLREGRIDWVVFEVNDRRLADGGSSRYQLFARLEGHGYRRARIPQVGLRRLYPRLPEQVPDEDVAFHRADLVDPASTT